ncbi:MAG: GNAT family N-acetyltransferase [Nitrospirae bacterium]|nr:GNAT family N-acetyltransferase [Nitrospirota bacterium]
MASLSLDVATREDVTDVCTLVNDAYRGEGGWTRETDLVSGPRITEKAVLGLIQRPDSYLLVGTMGGETVACVHLSRSGATAHIGLLSVQPGLQAQGLGSQVLDEAEQFAADVLGARTVSMKVIDQRPELIAFYERRGYKRIDRSDPYPVNDNAGEPKVSGLELLRLEKTLD